jgi:hypothetical protein
VTVLSSTLTANASPAFQALARGDYAAVVATTVDAPAGAGAAIEREDVPWVVGALAFLGRSAEAEALFETLPRADAVVGDAEPPEVVAARFFLAVALTREGRRDKARRLLVANLAARRRRPDDQVTAFFAAQGLTFFRHYEGLLGRARLWARRAFKAATTAAFPYGRALASEMLGLIELEAGLTRSGSRHLDFARQIAKSAGPGALEQAFDASALYYRAMFGLAPAPQIEAELGAAIAACRFEDSYTKADLMLQLARVYVLMGRLARAEALLAEVCQLVYQIDNPVLEVDYAVTLGNLLRRRGERLQALSIARGARRRAKPLGATRTVLRATGLEVALASELGLLTECDPLERELRALTLRSGSAVAARIAARGSDAAHASRPGEDPLGDLMDLAVGRPEAAVTAALKQGWLGLLTDLVGAGHERVLMLDVEPDALTICDRGEVVHVSGAATGFVRRLLEALAAGTRSKEQLALELWGRTYNPLRHDGPIYTLVAKTRKALEARGDWIEACEVGYRLRSGVSVRCRRRDARQEPRQVDAGVERIDGVDARLAAALNARQRTLLGALRAGEVVDPKAVMARFGVSDATATRDLAGLVDLKLAERVGKARSTRYVARGSGKSPEGSRAVAEASK